MSQDLPVVIGGGLAGLMAALHLQQPCILLCKAPLGEQAASGWAQGGLAASVSADDSPALHMADTLAAGDGICDPATVRRMVESAPGLVDELAELGARFDAGVGLEAGHSRRRIVHAMGDSSGREILRAVIAAVRRAGHVQVMETCAATRLLLRDGRVSGVLAEGPGGPFVLRSSRVTIATGGLGGLYRHSTNPAGAIGQGLVLAARAGAALADLEFVQFHPTALDVGLDPMPLVSEAVRGEGATLIDETGDRFMAGMGRAELEPRDVVSRAVWARMQLGHRVYLDARQALGARFATRFPGITATCRKAGIDPCTQPIPVRPAAHYHMGGIAVDAQGRSLVPGLWACGEAASTGLHGANRLASNSLLEAAITGRDVARSMAGTSAAPGTSLGASPAAALAGRPLLCAPASTLGAARVRDVLGRAAGVLRDAAGLARGQVAAARLLDESGAEGDGAEGGPALLALMMLTSMQRRSESRGGHARTDFPAKDPAKAHRMTLTWDETRRLTRHMGGQDAASAVTVHA